MRDFKFRVYDDLLEKMDDLNDYFKKGIHFGSALQTAKEIDLKIMQYTGLKDMNGTEIYEGDICLCDRNINDIIDKEEFVVNFEGGTFFLERENEIIYFREVIEPCNPNFLEVIGNIYEAPGKEQPHAKR